MRDSVFTNKMQPLRAFPDKVVMRLNKLLFFIFVISLLASSAHATTIVPLSDEALIIDARLIITGKVRSVTSAWNDERTLIWTYVEIERDRLLKGGMGDRTIVLKQAGGVAESVGMEIFGQPNFTPGQEVLLYLNADGEGNLHVAHLSLGMFSIATDAATGEMMVTRALDESKVEIRALDNTAEITNHAPLNDYLSKITTTLDREQLAVSRKEAQRAAQPLRAVPPEYERKKNLAIGVVPHFTLLGNGVRWMQSDTDEAIKFFINSKNSPVAGGGEDELTRALTSWPSQSGAKLQLQLAGKTKKCGLAQDNQNTISFGDCNNQVDDPSGCAGIVALTQVYWFENETKVVNGRTFKKIIEADIAFNNGFDCLLSTPANLAEVGCHEIGHAIGLSHSTIPFAIMISNARGGGRDATLGADDKNGVWLIYPASAGGIPTGAPRITKVSVKKGKKLYVYGSNFSPGSILVLNGVQIVPNSFIFDASPSRIFYKGTLPVGAAGTNVVEVINIDARSAPFVF